MGKKVILILLSLVMVMAAIVAGCAEPAATEEPAATTAPAATTEPAATTAAPATTTEPAATSEPAATEEPEEVIELRLATYTTEGQCAHWVNAVEEATSGRVDIVVYANSSLIALPDTITGLKDGICDISLIVLELFPQANPLNNVLTMPFLPLGGRETGYQIWHDLQDEFPEMTAEWGDFQVLWDVVSEGNVLHMVKSSAIAPEDMDGMRMQAGGTLGDIMGDLGATPVYLEVPDWFTSLDRGLLDGMWLPWDAVYELNIYPLLPYHTTFPTAPGVMMTNQVMNKDVWNSLPEDIQKIILELAPAEREDQWAKVSAKYAAAQEAVIAEGGTITELSPEEVNKWYEVAKPRHDAYLAEIDAMGLPGTPVYNRALELAAEYAK